MIDGRPTLTLFCRYVALLCVQNEFLVLCAWKVQLISYPLSCRFWFIKKYLDRALLLILQLSVWCALCTSIVYSWNLNLAAIIVNDHISGLILVLIILKAAYHYFRCALISFPSRLTDCLTLLNGCKWWLNFFLSVNWWCYAKLDHFLRHFLNDWFLLLLIENWYYGAALWSFRFLKFNILLIMKANIAQSIMNKILPLWWLRCSHLVFLMSFVNLIKCRKVLLCNEACFWYICTIFHGLGLIEALFTRYRLISLPGFHRIRFTLSTLGLFRLSLALALNDLWTIRLLYLLSLYWLKSCHRTYWLM